MAKIKATKRSSGHARAEIRRRYAIAWVEYIDLSRPPSTPITPSSPPSPSPSLWISPRHFEPRTQLCLRLWKILVSRPREAVLQLRFTSIGVPFARHSCGALLSLVLTMSPCYARTALIHVGYISISISTLAACRWYYAAWRALVPPEFLLASRWKTPRNATLTYYNARWFEIANRTSTSYTMFQYVTIEYIRKIFISTISFLYHCNIFFFY